MGFRVDLRLAMDLTRPVHVATEYKHGKLLVIVRF